MRYVYCLVAFALVASAAPVVAEHVEFRSCGGLSSTVNFVDVEPFPLSEGSSLTVTVEGIPAASASGGTYVYKVWYIGGVGEIPIPGEQWNLCRVTHCPVHKRSTTFVSRHYIPRNVPTGMYRIKISAKDRLRKLLLCVTLEIDLLPRIGIERTRDGTVERSAVSDITL